MSRLIRKSWIVFVQAITLSFESIMVELLTEIPGISSLLVAGISIPFAGATLLLISAVLSKKITVFNSWKLLLVGSIFLAAAVFLWYDSVTRVGASKEGLLAGPLETIVVLILAWLLLKEKLRKIQLVGVIIALLGFFATVSSRSLDLSSILPFVITFGDFEAILSAFAFAGGVIAMTRLVETHVYRGNGCFTSDFWVNLGNYSYFINIRDIYTYDSGMDIFDIFLSITPSRCIAICGRPGQNRSFADFHDCIF
jgi:drug/metabolite transporter (DMT)-like permease